MKFYNDIHKTTVILRIMANLIDRLHREGSHAPSDYKMIEAMESFIEYLINLFEVKRISIEMEDNINELIELYVKEKNNG